jgi:hypothetical protein
MDLIAEARSVLERNNYSVIRSRESDATIYFEDGNLMGFIWAAPTVGDICREWETRQDSFLKANSQFLRKSDLKAWNLYAVFLAMDEPIGEDRSNLVGIEEDFRAARKIARGGISTSKDVLVALLPLVPIQAVVSVNPEDALVRLKERVTSVPSSAVEIVLGDEGYSPKGADDILRAYADKRNRD